MFWTIKFEIPNFALVNNKELEFCSPMMKLIMNNRSLLRPGKFDWPEKRETDLFLYFTQSIQAFEEIKVPKGFTVETFPDDKNIDQVFAGFSNQIQFNKRKLGITFDFEIKRRQIPPDGYSGFQKCMESANNLANVIFVAGSEN